MGFLTSQPKMQELPAMPTEVDADQAAILEGQKQKKRKGFASTVLTSEETMGVAPTKKKTLLGE